MLRMSPAYPQESSRTSKGRAAAGRIVGEVISFGSKECCWGRTEVLHFRRRLEDRIGDAHSRFTSIRCGIMDARSRRSLEAKLPLKVQLENVAVATAPTRLKPSLSFMAPPPRTAVLPLMVQLEAMSLESPWGLKAKFATPPPREPVWFPRSVQPIRVIRPSKL